MISKLCKTLDLICRVIPDEKFLISSGEYDHTKVIGNQISFLKYLAEINSNI